VLRAIRPTPWELHFVVRAGLGPYERPGVTFNAPGLQTSADTDPTDYDQIWVIGAAATGRSTMDCPNGQANYDWFTGVGTVSFGTK